MTHFRQQAPAPASPEELVAQLREARRSTLALISDLDDDQLWGPRLAIVNPLLWELGHVGWFQEKFVLRELRGGGSLRPDGDALWDSTAIAHDDRWDLPLPSRTESASFAERVLEQVIEWLGRAQSRGGLSSAEWELVNLVIAHEDMHDEAFTYTRQTHGWSAPPSTLPASPALSRETADAGPLPGDVECEGGLFLLGAPRTYPFVLDNEQWEHSVQVESFSIARAPVTQSEYAAFVDDGGYGERALWSESGWSWRTEAGAEHPIYWRGGRGHWERRIFDDWVALEPHRPVVHVNWHEAQAWCRWAGRRLPTEAEWERAAAGPSPKRYLPWGSDAPDSVRTVPRANVDWAGLAFGGTVDVGAFPDGDSPSGCRQMIGNVWEWTASPFLPYPGFSPGPYREYSEPWFGDRRVLRGGAWGTPGRLLRCTWRNYHEPDRRDLLAGFRTCRDD